MGVKLPILTHIIHSPGPIYNPTQPHDPNKGFAIGGKRKEERLNKFPGPGSYDLSPKKESNKGFSMSRRVYKEKEDDSVGPNHYDVRMSFGKCTYYSKVKNSPGFKFNSKIFWVNIESQGLIFSFVLLFCLHFFEERTDLQKNNLTAAASIKSEYNPVFDYVKPQAPSWTISARNFQDLSKMAREIPAPNSYDPISSFDKSKSGKSMGIKYSPFVSTGFIVPSNDFVD